MTNRERALRVAETLNDECLAIERDFLDEVTFRRESGQKEGKAIKIAHKHKISRMALIVQRGMLTWREKG